MNLVSVSSLLEVLYIVIFSGNRVSVKHHNVIFVFRIINNSLFQYQLYCCLNCTNTLSLFVKTGSAKPGLTQVRSGPFALPSLYSIIQTLTNPRI